MPSSAYERISPVFRITYCGFSVLDFNYSTAAFRWIIGELSELADFEREEIELKVVRDFSCGKTKIIGKRIDDSSRTKSSVLEHETNYVWKLFTWSDDESYLAYLFRTDPDYPFTCHVFRAKSVLEAKEIIKFLHHSIKQKSQGWSQTFEKVSLLPISEMAIQEMPSSVSSSTSSGAFSLRDSFTSQFEVLYLCRVEINGSSPDTLVVDEAARKYDEEYKALQARDFVTASVKRLIANERSFSGDSGLRTQLRFSETEEDDYYSDENSETHQNFGIARRRRRSSLMIEALVDSVFLDDGYGSSPPSSVFGYKKGFINGTSTTDSPSLIDLVKIRAGSNRSMLLLVGQWDVSLISLSHKEELLKKKLTEISCVIQGSKYSNHFAFVCPDNWRSGRSDCFVIRCQDSNIASTAIRAMRTAFTVAFSEHASSGGRQHVCDRCPLFQYSCLCSEIDGLKPSNVHDVIVNRINLLPQTHKQNIWTGYKKVLNEFHESGESANGDSAVGDMRGSDFGNVQKKNVALMSVLRSVCEGAQVLHARSIGKLFNNGNGTSATSAEDEIYLTVSEGGDISAGIKAERRDVRQRSDNSSYQRNSATNRLVSLRDRAKNAFGGSLDSFIKKKSNNGQGTTRLAAKDENIIVVSSESETDVEAHKVNNEIKDMHKGSSFPPTTPRSPSDETMSHAQATFHFETPDRRGSDSDIYVRPRSSTVAGEVFGSDNGGKVLVTSKHTLYGHDKPTPLAFRKSNDRSNSSLTSMAMSRGRRMSWRQAIFTRVVSPRLFVSRHSVAGLGGLLLNDAGLESRRSSAGSTGSVHSPVQVMEDLTQTTPYKSLWRKAIMEQILALRLENQKKMKEDEAEEIRKLKLIYEEITPCSEDEVRPVWLEMLNHPKKNITRFDRVRLEEAVKAGVPRDLRSEIWKFLMSQHLLDRSKRSQMEMPPSYQYRDLLKDLTSYQHAILIDLGRTFPSHSYFSQPLGPGQLSLFNILKAYSLFDGEVGYCQGLSFIAGVLLLHMDEENAFEMLVDMMYRLQLRKQYRPDMLALQIEMYQLSRLLHDRHRDLHLHLEEHEIPILYAAPWFLTLFASAFPLGFVARVFDFVFLSGGLDVVFKIALILLGDHKELIKNCDSFESINDFLKTTLPQMSIIQMERIFNQVFELDISRELLAYEVEYHVLQEEVLPSPAPLTSNMSLPIGATTKQPATSHNASELAKLDTANRFLKRQNMELLEQLQDAHYRLALAEKVKLEMEVKLDAAAGSLSSCQCKVKTLETRIEALELERKSLLAALQRSNGLLSDPISARHSNNSVPASSGSTPTNFASNSESTNRNPCISRVKNASFM